MPSRTIIVPAGQGSYVPTGQEENFISLNWVIKFFRLVDTGEEACCQWAETHGLRVGEPVPEQFELPQYRHRPENRKLGDFYPDERPVLIEWRRCWGWLSLNKPKDLAMADPIEFFVDTDGTMDPLIRDTRHYVGVLKCSDNKLVGIRCSDHKLGTLAWIGDLGTREQPKSRGKGMMSQLACHYTHGRLAQGSHGQPPQEQNAVLPRVGPPTPMAEAANASRLWALQEFDSALDQGPCL